MREWRRTWHDVGGAGFLSTPVLLAFLAWAIPSTLYTEVAASGAPLVPWIGASAASALAVTLLLWLVGRLTRRRQPHGPGPWAAVAVYLAAGALRGLLLWSAANALDLASTVGLTSRIINSAAWSIVAMGCASIVVNRRSQHRALMAGLAARRRQLLGLQSSLGVRIAQTRRDLAEQVQAELAPTLAQLQGELDGLAQGTDADVDNAVERFRAAVTHVVRPLSRTLAEPHEQPWPAPTPPAPLDPPRVSERIALSSVIAPLPSSGLVLLLLALLALAVAPQAYRTADAPLRVMVFVVCLAAGLMVVRWAAQRVGWQSSTRDVLICLAVAYIALAVFTGLLTRALTRGLEAQATTFPALAVALAALVPLAVSVATALQRLGRMAELRSAETVAELDLLTAVLRRELWRERRRLALTVHGPIQSALVAAAVSLSRPGFTPSDVPALTASLDQAMAHIDRASGPLPAIDAAARDLAALWTDTAAVGFVADPTLTRIIDSDEALRAVVIEVLREGISNAVRHGSADHIEMSIDAPAPGILRVTVADDGDGAPLSVTPGLGSVMLGEVALDWGLSRLGSTTLLTVDLAIDPARAPRPCASMTDVNQVVLEHLVMRIAADGRLALATRLEPLPSMADPVQVAEAAFPGTFTHSTSWRWSPDGVLLTFTHVHPDPRPGDVDDAGLDDAGLDDARLVSVLDLEQLPVACHAVRHLHFLERTDRAIADMPGYERFWAYAAAVAEHHYPAVAGLLPGPPEYHI